MTNPYWAFPSSRKGGTTSHDSLIRSSLSHSPLLSQGEAAASRVDAVQSSGAFRGLALSLSEVNGDLRGARRDAPVDLAFLLAYCTVEEVGLRCLCLGQNVLCMPGAT